MIITINVPVTISADVVETVQNAAVQKMNRQLTPEELELFFKEDVAAILDINFNDGGHDSLTNKLTQVYEDSQDDGYTSITDFVDVFIDENLD